MYEVKFGDILWDISCKYDISICFLVKWNGMVFIDLFMLGKILVIWVNEVSDE